MGRRGQLKELIAKHEIDCVCLQETIKKEFSVKDWRDLGNNAIFEWNWVPAKGHSGGLLMGIRKEKVEEIECDKGEFFTSMRFTSREDKFRWELINVYGPVQTEREQSFLQELDEKMRRTNLPVLIGGRF